MSPSRQFIIYASSAALRGAVSELAEQTKANLLALLRQPDRWKTPIVVNLQPEQANLPEIPPAALRFSQTGFGLKLQLDLTIGESVDAALVERELLRAILLEMIYRSEPDVAPGTAFVEPPDWLLDGVLAITPGRDRGPLWKRFRCRTNRCRWKNFFGNARRFSIHPVACFIALIRSRSWNCLSNGTDGRSRLARSSIIYRMPQTTRSPI